jgi:hypothetical protein
MPAIDLQSAITTDILRLGKLTLEARADRMMTRQGCRALILRRIFGCACSNSPPDCRPPSFLFAVNAFTQSLLLLSPPSFLVSNRLRLAYCITIPSLTGFEMNLEGVFSVPCLPCRVVEGLFYPFPIEPGVILRQFHYVQARLSADIAEIFQVSAYAPKYKPEQAEQDCNHYLKCAHFSLPAAAILLPMRAMKQGNASCSKLWYDEGRRGGHEAARARRGS